MKFKPYYKDQNLRFIDLIDSFSESLIYEFYPYIKVEMIKCIITNSIPLKKYNVFTDFLNFDKFYLEYVKAHDI